jgi:hypothetical protein
MHPGFGGLSGKLIRVEAYCVINATALTARLLPLGSSASIAAH